MTPIFATLVMQQSPDMPAAIVLAFLCSVLAVIAVIVSGVYHSLSVAARRRVGWAAFAVLVLVVGAFTARRVFANVIIDCWIFGCWYDVLFW